MELEQETYLRGNQVAIAIRFKRHLIVAVTTISNFHGFLHPNSEVDTYLRPIFVPEASSGNCSVALVKALDLFVSLVEFFETLVLVLKTQTVSRTISDRDMVLIEVQRFERETSPTIPFEEFWAR